MRNIKECSQCEPTRCFSLRVGRLINSNERAVYPIDPRKISTSSTSIEDCEKRKPLWSSDDELQFQMGDMNGNA